MRARPADLLSVARVARRPGAGWRLHSRARNDLDSGQPDVRSFAVTALSALAHLSCLGARRKYDAHGELLREGQATPSRRRSCQRSRHRRLSVRTASLIELLASRPGVENAAERSSVAACRRQSFAWAQWQGRRRRVASARSIAGRPERSSTEREYSSGRAGAAGDRHSRGRRPARELAPAAARCLWRGAVDLRARHRQRGPALRAIRAPASGDAGRHFRHAGGLFRMGVEIAFYALQASDGAIFSGRADPQRAFEAGTALAPCGFPRRTVQRTAPTLESLERAQRCTAPSGPRTGKPLARWLQRTAASRATTCAGWTRRRRPAPRHRWRSRTSLPPRSCNPWPRATRVIPQSSPRSAERLHRRTRHARGARAPGRCSRSSNRSALRSRRPGRGADRRPRRLRHRQPRHRAPRCRRRWRPRPPARLHPALREALRQIIDRLDSPGLPPAARSARGCLCRCTNLSITTSNPRWRYGPWARRACSRAPGPAAVQDLQPRSSIKSRCSGRACAAWVRGSDGRRQQRGDRGRRNRPVMSGRRYEMPWRTPMSCMPPWPGAGRACCMQLLAGRAGRRARAAAALGASA